MRLSVILPGVLTKPDLIDKGTEVQVLKAVKNEVISLRKGYTIVKCRGQAALDKKQKLQDATRDEKAFFENHEIFRFGICVFISRYIFQMDIIFRTICNKTEINTCVAYMLICLICWCHLIKALCRVIFRLNYS